MHDRSAEEISEQLALHALGLLDSAEAQEVEAHATQCDSCARELLELRESFAAVGQTSEPVRPPEALRAKVIDITNPQVWKGWDHASPADMLVVREGEGEWQKVREGVFAKQLYVDQTRDLVTMLIRMEPGARYVSHRHAAPEQCYVLQGDIRDGDVVCEAGDFQVLEPGTVHGAQWTKNGCVVLIVSSLRDELIT